MTFAWPHLLWLLALPLGLLVAEIALARRSALGGAGDKILRGEAGSRSLSLGGGGSHRRPLRRVWLALGLALCIVALARPQWGKVDEQVFDQSREILVALDLSKSMLSTDVKPSRLERAKLLVQVLLDRLKGERIGLVVFSGTSFLQCPLSTDYEILRDFLPSLSPATLPEGGTNYRALLETALHSFSSGSSADRYLIILSDGEALDDDWQPLVPELKQRNIRVIGLGVGTQAGSFIPDGSGGFVKDENGAVVLSKLEPSTLQELASATHGTYRDASAWVDLATVLRQTVEAGRTGAFVEKHEQRAIERYQWVLAPGVILLLISLAFEFPVQVRPRQVALGRPTSTDNPASPGKGTAALLLTLLLALATGPRLSAAEPAASGPSTPLGNDVARLSAKPALNAADCASLARQTITWGQGLRSSGQPLAEGPLRDASDAIDLGSRLDPKAADWDKLRSQIDALSEKPPEQKKQPPKQQDQKKQDKDKSQKKQDQQKQNARNKSSPSKPQDQQQKNDSSSKNQDKPSPSSPSSQNPSKPDDSSASQPKPQPPNSQSGFGNMKKPAAQPQPTPPQAEPMQTVGGADHQARRAKEDPALLIPLEKLNQVKADDSPGKLFQMIQAERKPVPTPAHQKDW